MGKYSKQTGKFSNTDKRAKRAHGLLWILPLLAVLLGIAGALVWMQLSSRDAAVRVTEPTVFPSADSQQTGQLQSDTEPATAPASAPSQPVTAATGDKTDAACKASYTVSPQAASADKIVATAGESQLTNGMLQILYLSQVNAYRASNQTVAPDFGMPLEYQSCPLTDGLSWQHYFLEKAITGWQAQQAALFAATQPRPVTEEDYKPNQTDDLHGKYIAPELPVNDFLYQDLPCYTPNQLHQDYLDNLSATLDSLAVEAGFASLEEMARQANISAQDFLQAAQDYNTAYMFFTEESYDLDPTDEEVAAYLQSSALSASGSKTVDIRHILLLPQGAQTAADGTVSATEEQWAQALRQAQQLLSDWKTAAKSRDAEAEFARIANGSSDDTGSSLNGGFYSHLSPGQLIAPLDEWCFADGRQAGDTEIIRSDYGIHIVYLSSFQDTALTQARSALLSQLEQEKWEAWRKEVPLSPDYSAAELWVDTTTPLPSLEDTLYPDIAHERFPEAIVYLQQDYFYFPYGDREIGKNGCGITTFAMLATYMTDSLQTPPMMATRFDRYFDRETHGTNGDLFLYAPAEMGFYLEKQSFDLEEVIQALKNGQVVISRQEKGDFTSSGHYLLIQRYNEEDDTFQVRDSNVYNYGSRPGHRVDKFTRANILSGGAHFYIMQQKITSIPACTRCGSAATDGSSLLEQDYICEKCTVALSRRNHFLAILDELSQPA